MKRSEPSSPASASTSVRLVEPTSLTTAVDEEAASASTTSPGRAATGAAQKIASAPSAAAGDGAGGTIERADRQRPFEVRGIGVVADDLGAEPAPGRQPDRAADQPDAEDGEPRRPDGWGCGALHAAIFA